MNIILLSQAQGKLLDIGSRRLMLLAVMSLILLPVGLAGLAYYQGVQAGRASLIGNWQQDVAQQRRRIEFAKQQSEANIDALTRRLGQLQVRLSRMDALGSKLVAMADLDKTQFDFDQTAGLGGPEEPAGEHAGTSGMLDVGSALDDLSKQLAEREDQLRILERLVLTRNLHQRLHPHGRPVQGGWLSSGFGERTDPFTGKPAFHPGVDITAKLGTPIVAVAAGVVTYAGKRPGYGNLVEISHGNGYLTRYGHNRKLKVQVGQTVERGDTIALMGSTGRSTGPHVHFEVVKDGKRVDPAAYLTARQ